MGGKNSRYHRNTARNFAGAEMLASLVMRGSYLPPRLSPLSLGGRSVRKSFFANVLDKCAGRCNTYLIARTKRGKAMLEMFLGLDTSKWNNAPRYRRRRAVVFTLLAVVAGFVIWQVATNLWWTAGGYCWGDYFECYGA